MATEQETKTDQEIKTEQQQVLDKIKEIEAFCCIEFTEEKWQDLTTPNKTLVLACRRFFNWVSIAHSARNDLIKRSSSPHYKKYQDHAKPTVDDMINSWNASGLSQAE